MPVNKTRCVLLLITHGFWTCWVSSAQTNKVFLTDDGFLAVDRSRKVEQASKLRESLPCDVFTEGNWGPATNGFQMSLRLEQTNPAAGEQIITTILLRNVTNTVLSYGVSSVAGEDGPIGFVVSTTNGPVARTRSEPPTIVSAKILELAPETQHKYEERIDKRFDLKHAGIYTVYARYGAGCPKCFEIRSAEITLEIHQ